MMTFKEIDQKIYHYEYELGKSYQVVKQINDAIFNEKATSGMLYKDASHELRIDGGDNIQLSSGGKIVFQSE